MSANGKSRMASREGRVPYSLFAIPYSPANYTDTA
jgi:hypothetical protein